MEGDKSNGSINSSGLDVTSVYNNEKAQYGSDMIQNKTVNVTELPQIDAGIQVNCVADSSTHVFRGFPASENTDFNNEEQIVVNLSLSNDSIMNIEKQLNRHERVSTAFLFFDDVQLSLMYCEKSLSSYKFRGLIEHSKDMSPALRSAKLLECLFLMKNYFLLEKHGLDKYAAKKVFSESSNISNERLILFNIFESLTQSEARMIMDSVTNLPNEEYLEIFFLKLSQPRQWITIGEVMENFTNQNCTSLIEGYRELIVNKQIEKVSLNENYELEENMLLDCDNDAYPIKNPDKVGVCLIINQETFQRLPTRKGTDKDVSALVNVLSSLNFDMFIARDQQQRFFGSPLSNFITDKFKDYHSIFFMVILSHGAEGSIYCSDDKPVSIEKDIYTILNSVPNLKNIPKVLIIQACQGEKYLISDKLTINTDDVDSLTDDMYSEVPALKNMIGEYISDAFIVMSTVPGFKSFRLPETGSYFIQSLSQCLYKYQDDHIYDIITEVMKQVDAEVVASKYKGLNFGQQPICNSVLKRKLYLKPFKQPKDK